jgi:hypothetical protein
VYDLAHFTTVDSVKCGSELRALGANSRCMEEAANEIVRFFFDNFVERQSGAPSCVLARMFKTHDYLDLDDDLKAFARRLLEKDAEVPNCKCFTLLATRGVNEEWNSRKNSKGHQAIPLPSVKVVEKIPMMRNIIKQMGLEINTVVSPDPAIIMDLSQKTFSVFNIPQAQGSPYVPAQEEFVIPYGVQSAFGFGGVLPSGNVFVLIIFSRTPVSEVTANRFAPMALNAKMVILPFEETVFVGE